MQLDPVNAQLWGALDLLGVSSVTLPGMKLRQALGFGPGEAGDERSLPIYAFLVADIVSVADNPSLVVFAATTGRLVRFEWTLAASLSTTIPLERVTQVEERDEDTALGLTIHVDSHTRTTVSQYEDREAPMADDGARVRRGIAQSQSEGLTFRLIKTGDEMLALAEFSRRLRLLIGA